MSDLRGRNGSRFRASRRLAAGVLALALGAALIPSVASAHVERTSYWPDSGVDTADGQPTGGAVPVARDLFTALDAGAPGDTLVVCQAGAPVTPPQQPISRLDQEVSRPSDPQVTRARQDVQVSRARVKRLELKLRILRKTGRTKKARKVKRRLTRAKRAYRVALAAEHAARQAAELEYQRAVQAARAGAEQQYQQDLAAEQAARKQADEEHQQALEDYEADLQQYEQDLEDDPSMQRLDAALDDAEANGYELRPSEPRVQVTEEEADRLWDFNAQLLAQCAYSEIQAAINDAGNNDRVVVMPGIYTEETSRAVPSFNDPDDPEWQDNPCKELLEVNDTGNPTARSYRYQFKCPNHQNLIAVMGREPKKNPDGSEFVPEPADPADPRRDGIPDAGECIRCNLQLEGSGISPDDVVVDSGRVESGNGAPMGSVKDIGIRADRADGFVLRNMTVRHSGEHDIYSPETDGLLLERFKTYFNGHYGVLTFVAEHHLIQDCDAAGSGDAAIYPGSSAEYGEQVDPDFDADDPSVPHTESGQFGTEIRRCDMHHSATGYSGTAGNSVHVHDNDFYDNAMGFVTDVFTASGHPGFPQDSDLIEDNEFYSNNFNPFVEANDDGLPGTDEELSICDSANGEEPGPHGPEQGCTDVVPRIPAPVGTGMFLPGVNNNTIRNNHFWDNWRRGTMLFSVPDNFVCGNVNPVAGGNQQHGCDEAEVNTSHRNEHHGNTMGRSPVPEPGEAPDPTWPGGANEEDPNGLDFWWDQFPGNARNCWYENNGPEADGSGLTSIPPAPLLPGDGAQSCENSVGTGGAFGQEAELLSCLGDFALREETGNETEGQGTDACEWFVTPPEPQPTP